MSIPVIVAIGLIGVTAIGLIIFAFYKLDDEGEDKLDVDEQEDDG